MKMRYFPLFDADKGAGGGGGAADPKAADPKAADPKAGEGGAPVDPNLKDPVIAKLIQDAARAEIDRVVANRDTILAEKKQLADRLKQFEGLDVDEFKRYRDTVSKSEEARMIADGKLDEVIAKRVSGALSESDAKLKNLMAERDATAAERDEFRQSFHSLMIDNALTSAALKAGVKEDVLEAVKLLGKQVWKVHNKKIAALDDAGQPLTVRKGTSFKEMSIDDWYEQLAERSPSFFKTSTGGGSGGSGVPAKAASKEDVARGLVSLESIAGGKTRVM